MKREEEKEYLDIMLTILAQIIDKLTWEIAKIPK